MLLFVRKPSRMDTILSWKEGKLSNFQAFLSTQGGIPPMPLWALIASVDKLMY